MKRGQKTGITDILNTTNAIKWKWAGPLVKRTTDGPSQIRTYNEIPDERNITKRKLGNMTWNRTICAIDQGDYTKDFQNSSIQWYTKLLYTTLFKKFWWNLHNLHFALLQVLFYFTPNFPILYRLFSCRTRYIFSISLLLFVL